MRLHNKVETDSCPEIMAGSQYNCAYVSTLCLFVYPFQSGNCMPTVYIDPFSD